MIGLKSSNTVNKIKYDNNIITFNNNNKKLIKHVVIYFFRF